VRLLIVGKAIQIALDVERRAQPRDETPFGRGEDWP
jgi:hypothetical protein